MAKKLMLVFALLVALLGKPYAQEALKFTIQVKTWDNKLTTGKLISLTSDSISIEGSKHRSYLYHYSTIKLVKYRHHKSTTIGGFVGGLTGFIIGGVSAVSSSNNDCTSYCFELDPGVEFLGGGLLGAMGGVLIGTVAGSVLKVHEINGGIEQWSQFKLALETKGSRYNRNKK